MTVRWGVLGAGAICERAMLAALRGADGASLAALASRSPARASALAAAHEVPAVYGSYAELLESPDVDAVYVALANDAHAPWTIAALDAGKHVLCEKPLGLTAAEVSAMSAAASASGRLLVEASWYRWHPRVRLVERLLHTLGALGAVRYVSAGFSFAGVAAGNYRLDPLRGGGALYDVGCYAASAAVWAFGSPPLSAAATVVRGDTGVDLSADVTVTFEGGRADLHASIASEPRQWLVIDGERGSLELREAPFTAWDGQAVDLVFTSAAGTEVETVEPANAYALMVSSVSSAITGSAEAWTVPLTDSLATAAILDAAFASASSGGSPAPVSS